LYDFIDNNPICEFHPIDYVNDPFVIAKNDKMVAINSALQVDLTGQVCADSIGYSIYSGFGGQVDFIRGAARSRGGRPIIALPSTAKNDTVSRIVLHLDEGAGVVTSRGDVHYVVTEFGVAYLHGRSIRERAKALIDIAHPKFRDELTSQAKKVKFL
jgi:acetyl-CoA hydrolase